MNHDRVHINLVYTVCRPQNSLTHTPNRRNTRRTKQLKLHKRSKMHENVTQTRSSTLTQQYMKSE